MKTFFTRLGSAIVFAVLMVAGILVNKFGFMVLMTAILVGCLHEFYNITATRRETPAFPLARKWFLIGIMVVAYWVSFLLASDPVRAFPDANNLVKALFQIILMQRDSALALNAIIPCLVFLLFFY